MFPHTARHPMFGPPPVAAQSLEFAHGPENKLPVDVPQGRVQGRLVEGPIVVHPPPDSRVEHPGQVLKILVAAQMQLPAPDFLPNPLRRFAADGRAEIHEVFPPPVLRSPGTKRIPKKIKRHAGKLASPITVPAVDNLRLLRVQGQPTVGKTTLQSVLQVFSLPQIATVAYTVIRVPLELYARKVPGHPHVKNIMQKEIRQQRIWEPYGYGNLSPFGR